MQKINVILGWLVFLGFGACFNVVFFCWWDLVTLKEAITVFSLGGLTTAIALLINSIVN
jgi:hypothetical protein